MRMGPGYQESGRKNQFKMTQQIHWDYSTSKVPEDPMTQVFPLMARSNLIKVDLMKRPLWFFPHNVPPCMQSTIKRLN